MVGKCDVKWTADGSVEQRSAEPRRCQYVLEVTSHEVASKRLVIVSFPGDCVRFTVVVDVIVEVPEVEAGEVGWREAEVEVDLEQMRSDT